MVDGHARARAHAHALATEWWTATRERVRAQIMEYHDTKAEPLETKVQPLDLKDDPLV